MHEAIPTQTAVWTSLMTLSLKSGEGMFVRGRVATAPHASRHQPAPQGFRLGGGFRRKGRVRFQGGGADPELPDRLGAQDG